LEHVIFTHTPTTITATIEIPIRLPNGAKIKITSRDVLDFLLASGEEIIDFAPGCASNISEEQRRAVFVFQKKVQEQAPVQIPAEEENKKDEVIITEQEEPVLRSKKRGKIE
jgi:hypothetical protein